MKKIIVLLITLLSALTIFIGCSSLDEYYSENSTEFLGNSRLKAPTSDGITLDGIADESKWGETVHHVHKEKGVTIDTAVTFGNNGWYFSVDVLGEGIYHNASYNHAKNSSIALFVMNAGLDPKDYWKSYAAITVDAKDDICTMPIKYAAETVVKGELNSKDAQGMSTEIYLPYSSLGHIEKPDKIFVYANYNSVVGTSTNTAVNRWIKAGRVDVGGLFYLFDENGWTDEDDENDFLGDSIQGAVKTGGWDLSKKDEGIYRSENNDNQWLFVRNSKSSHYSIEATMKIVGGINDKAPQFGLLIAADEDEKYAMLLEGRPATVESKKAILRVLTLDSSWTTQNTGVNIENVDLTENGVKLKVFRDGRHFHYLINGKVVYSAQLPVRSDTTCGLYTVGGEAIYTDVKYEDFTDNKVALYEALDEYSGNVIVPTEGIIGGRIEVKESVVEDNASTKVNIIAYSGYKLKSVMVNGRVCTSEAKSQTQNGVWVIPSVTESKRISASFEKVPADKVVTISGRVLADNGGVVSGQIVKLYSDAFCYETTISHEGKIELKVEKGEYEFYLKPMGFWAYTTSINAQENIDLGEIELIYSQGLPVNATLTNKQGIELRGNTTYEYGDESVQGSKVGLLYTLLDDSLGEVSMVMATISFVEKTTDNDCSAGFVFTSSQDKNGDGVAENALENGFTVLWYRNGIRTYNFNDAQAAGWVNGQGSYITEANLGLNDFRTSPGTGKETLMVVRKGTTYYIFRIVGGEVALLTTRTYDKYSGEMAIGFMTSGCIAKYEYYSFTTDAEEIDAFLESQEING
jgi:hypothetical protein